MLFQNPTIALDELPQLDASPEEQPEKALLRLALLSRAIVILFLLIGATVVSFLPAPVGVKALLWGVVLALGIFLVIAAHKSYNRKAFALRQHDLSYRSGWLWHQVTTVPFKRVQHVEVQQGPLERAMGLASLKVFTAGGSSSDLSVPGLKPEKARELKAFILQRVNEHGR